MFCLRCLVFFSAVKRSKTVTGGHEFTLVTSVVSPNSSNSFMHEDEYTRPPTTL
uniref:Uncharacterized protein n=1 Tax=Amphimedon queenslandica TaxID=400682 RepID=A0A1X7V3X2_AMPQE